MIGTPLNDKVLVKRIAAVESTKGGLIIPENAKEKPYEGEIIAVGPGYLHEGKRIKLDVKIGDRIVFGKYAGLDIKVDGEEYMVMKEEEVLIKIPKGD